MGEVFDGDVPLDVDDDNDSPFCDSGRGDLASQIKNQAAKIKNAEAKADKKTKQASAASDQGASKQGGAPATSVADQVPEAAAVSAESTGTKPASAGHMAGSDTGIVGNSLKTTTPTASQDDAPTQVDSTPKPKRITSILSSLPAAGSPLPMTASSPQPAADSPPTTGASARRSSPRSIVVYHRKGVGSVAAGLVA